MTWLVRLAAVAVLFVGSVHSAASQETHQAPVTVSGAVNADASQCRTPWTDGLRRPERFTLVMECVTVTGTVIDVRPEADGDLHIPVRLDDDPGILNERNVAGQHGGLL